MFKLAPPAAPGDPWTETVLFRFSGGSDGGLPNYNVIFDAASALYGTTSAGGIGCPLYALQAAGCGTVFKLTPPDEVVEHGLGPRVAWVSSNTVPQAIIGSIGLWRARFF